jgi:hypothetical protein
MTFKCAVVYICIELQKIRGSTDRDQILASFLCRTRLDERPLKCRVSGLLWSSFCTTVEKTVGWVTPESLLHHKLYKLCVLINNRTDTEPTPRKNRSEKTITDQTLFDNRTAYYIVTIKTEV